MGRITGPCEHGGVVKPRGLSRIPKSTLTRTSNAAATSACSQAGAGTWCRFANSPSLTASHPQFADEVTEPRHRGRRRSSVRSMLTRRASRPFLPPSGAGVASGAPASSSGAVSAPRAPDRRQPPARGSQSDYQLGRSRARRRIRRRSGRPHRLRPDRLRRQERGVQQFLVAPGARIVTREAPDATGAEVTVEVDAVQRR